jgi:catechol 2,3-dioxygenase
MSDAIDPGARIGHVHLKVSDIARAETFYRDVLGFEVTTRYGADAVFMSAGGYHHHIGLNVWHSKGGSPPAHNTTGLFHFAILYPDRRSLARALKHVLDSGWPIDGASDHGVSEAIYLHDPDFNGIELYRDRDPSEWPRHPDGSLAMATDPLDVQGLLAEAD